MEDTEVIQIGRPLYLGVLGTHEAITKQALQDCFLAILEVLGRPPERCCLPSEGRSSMFLEAILKSMNVPIQEYEADWHTHGRRAKIFRDTRIQKESTVFLVFLNKRSDSNEKTAVRLVKKGHQVFTIHHESLEIEELMNPSSEPSPPSSAGPTKRESKRGTGKAQGSKQSVRSEGPGIQTQLPLTWTSSHSAE